MRLLKYNNDGEFSLTKDFVGDKIPGYAILSHTWGADTEEVTYRELIDGTGKNKVGYEKIRFCGEQARLDGLQYFWVDTCCIDKSNAVELQEAINSMFRWYHNAVKCYVYLSDVSTKQRKASNLLAEYTWEPAFRSSKWFTRGWTLQELLAPSLGSVEFFSQERDRLGNKRSLEQQIHEITGIPLSALRGTPLSQFNIEDRLLWAGTRQTTREEDRAYSMLGICDVYMPLIYGEGEKNAFRRLRKELGLDNDLLHSLPYAIEAPFNSVDRQDELICLPNTRVDLLQEICDWTDGQDERCIFWLNGLAGTGKSTIARTIARRYCKEERLGASFFFSRGGGDVSHAGKLFTSIAVQLANNIPSLRYYICDAISSCKDIASRSFRDQWSQLILSPLSKLGSSSSSSSYVLVIDALDECDKDEHIRMILRFLAEARTLKTARLRVFLTSRPEIPIRHGFYQIPDAEHHDFILHNVSPTIVNRDISLFLEYNLGIIRQEWTLGTDWPGEVVLRQLVLHACGLFIWAATACRFIREGKRFARKRLRTILKGSSSAITAPEKHLNEIYLAVLKHSLSAEYSDEEREEVYNILKYTLGSIVVLLSPLSTSSLSRLLHLPREDINRTFEDLHAILDIPKDPTRPLHLHHPSFRDFLLNKDRCGDFWVDEKEAHQILATSCIQLMSQTLKKDICEMHAPGKTPNLHAFIHDAKRFALYNRSVIEQTPLQLYCSALVFAPEKSIVRETFKKVQTYWCAALQTLEGHSSSVSSVAFSPDGKQVVSGSGDNTVRLWDAATGAALQTLEGHSSSVWSVAFSPDGKQVVSGSYDHTVRLWDAATGAALQTLEGHSSYVASVAFSPDGKQVVSGSGDHTVRLWDAATGAALQTLEGHSSSVGSVAFSPDGKQVVSGSGDNTVRLWDAATGAALQTLEGHSSSVGSVAFSPDGKQVVSGSGDHTVRLWDAATGAALQTLEGHSSSVGSVAFSPDGKQVVSGSGDHTVRLWDAATGAALQTLEGHSSSVSSVAFSPDGKQVVSGSGDNTVRLWDAATGAALQTLEGHSSSVASVAFSPDGKQVVSGSGDNTVRLWDAATGAALQTLEGHSSSVDSVAFSPDGNLLPTLRKIRILAI
ncbi:hypothetical protein BGZ60DRAFT_473956 [Tricladium varicosporioides]|nr:hypothetical protein BGZ60DRAFT_473956 [Hymenoscyphus varicosporioides]